MSRSYFRCSAWRLPRPLSRSSALAVEEQRSLNLTESLVHELDAPQGHAQVHIASVTSVDTCIKQISKIYVLHIQLYSSVRYLE